MRFSIPSSKLASSVVLTIDIYSMYYVYGSDFASSTRECELAQMGWRKSGNSAKSSVFDNISQLASATAIFLTVFTDEIYQTPLPINILMKLI